MRYEYNGNLIEYERIELVAKEIVEKYKDISYDKALEAAMLEGYISKDITLNDILLRLYNIMFVNKNNKKIVTKVFKDFVEELYNYNDDNDNIYYYDLITEIQNYLNNKSSFPIFVI